MTPSPRQVLISVSSRASANGVYFYNGIFEALGMDAVYLSCPTDSLRGFRESFDFMKLHAASVAAPFKNEVVGLLDALTDSARGTGSVNAVRSEGGRLLGHNTDVDGIVAVLRESGMDMSEGEGEGGRPRVVVYGSGGVVPSAVFAVRQLAPDAEILLASRNAQAGQALAARLETGWTTGSAGADYWLNATPAGIEEPERALVLSEGAAVVFDFAASQAAYPFEDAARARGQRFLRGFDFYRAQFLAQFEFYFQKTIQPALFDGLAAKRLTP